MRYAQARADRELWELSYRVYVTDSLRLQGEGKYIPQRWFDLLGLDNGSSEPDDRPAEEIVSDIWSRAGLAKKG